MARYEKLFDAFGPTALGQTVAATVIGALVGFGASRKMAPTDGIPSWSIALGGAVVGFVGAMCLILVEARRKRVKAGLAKPRSAAFWIVAGVVVVVIFLGICVTFVAIPLLQ